MMPEAHYIFEKIQGITVSRGCYINCAPDQNKWHLQKEEIRSNAEEGGEEKGSRLEHNTGFGMSVVLGL